MRRKNLYLHNPEFFSAEKIFLYKSLHHRLQTDFAVMQNVRNRHRKNPEMAVNWYVLHRRQHICFP